MQEPNFELLEKIFGGLPEETLPSVITTMKVKKLEAGERLIQQGEMGDRFYVICCAFRPRRIYLERPVRCV